MRISLGDCTKNTGSTTNEEKPGTPAGMQFERAVKGYLPANTSSFDFFIASAAHGFKFGLVTSAILNVAFGTYG